MQENNLNLLDSILKDKFKINKGLFSFSDYMDVLKSLQLISNSNLTSKEEALLARSWHLISFYQSGDIASSLNNVRVFVSGILGLSEKWMFKTVRIGFNLYSALQQTINSMKAQEKS